MRPVIRHTYNVVRSIIVFFLVTVVTLYALLYILLCIPSIQQKIKAEGEKELSKFLKTNVQIGELSIKPFNQVVLYDVVIPDQKGGDLIQIDVLGAGLNMQKLLADKRIEVNYAELLGLHGHITKADKDSPTNLQFIIDAFKPKKKKEPTKFDLAIRNIVIRNTDLRYDLLSEPRKQNKFDANHVGIINLCADVDIPRLKNDDFLIDVKRLSFGETSGFVVKQISTKLAMSSLLLRAEKSVKICSNVSCLFNRPSSSPKLSFNIDFSPYNRLSSLSPCTKAFSSEYPACKAPEIRFIYSLNSFSKSTLSL